MAVNISVDRSHLSKKQLLYLNSPEDEVLFGGARRSVVNLT